MFPSFHCHITQPASHQDMPWANINILSSINQFISIENCTDVVNQHYTYHFHTHMYIFNFSVTKYHSLLSLSRYTDSSLTKTCSVQRNLAAAICSFSLKITIMFWLSSILSSFTHVHFQIFSSPTILHSFLCHVTQPAASARHAMQIIIQQQSTNFFIENENLLI